MSEVVGFLSSQILESPDGTLTLKEQGTVRAWLAEHAVGDRLVPILEDWLLFGEWVRVEHGADALRDEIYLCLQEIGPRIEQFGLTAMLAGSGKLFARGQVFDERLRPKDQRPLPVATGRRVGAGPMARFLLNDDDGL